MTESNPYKPPNQFACRSCGENFPASEIHCPRCTFPENKGVLLRWWVLGGTFVLLIGFHIYQLIKNLFITALSS